jgi:tetratricopeptide (TPR) repeat protein
MKNYLGPRTPSEVIKRGYRDDEIISIYSLGRLSLECGNLKRADRIFRGLTQVTPDFLLAWLGLGYVHMMYQDFESALENIKRALTIQKTSVEAMLMMAICSLNSGDLNTAGMYLGETKDLIDSLREKQRTQIDPRIIALLDSQIVRFQTR